MSEYKGIKGFQVQTRTEDPVPYAQALANNPYAGSWASGGDLPQAKIKNFMNRSKLLIHTSQYETFGLVAIEANAMGVPILSINTGSLIEIIENNKNGYFAEDFTNNNVNTFVKDLLNDDDYFNNVMINCIQKSEKYDWNMTADSLLKTYQEVKLS